MMTAELDRSTMHVHISQAEYADAEVIKIEIQGGANARAKVSDALIMELKNLLDGAGINWELTHQPDR
jgi:hypothetical protein